MSQPLNPGAVFIPQGSAQGDYQVYSDPQATHNPYAYPTEGDYVSNDPGGYGNEEYYSEYPPEAGGVYANPYQPGQDYSEGYGEGAYNGWYERLSEYVGGTTGAPVTCLKFDTCSELMWVATEDGSVSSYIGTDFDLYSRFKATARPGNNVRSILTCETGVVLVTESTFSLRTRGGYALLTGTDLAQGFNCADWVDTRGPRSSSVVLGANDRLMVFDLNARRTVTSVDHMSGVTCVGRNRSNLVCGTVNGLTEIVDSNTLQTVHTFEGHSGGISNIDVRNDMIVTCGYTSRQGQLGFDPLIKIYDLRFNKPKPLNSVPAPTGTSFVKWHPLIPSQLIASTQSGQVVVFPDVQNPLETPQYYQIASGGAPVVAMDMSSSGEVMVLADGGGGGHQLTERESPLKINLYSVDLDVPDLVAPPPPATLQTLGMDDRAPWNGMRVEAGGEPLTSTFPEQYQFRPFPFGHPTMPIPEVVTATVTNNGFMGVGKRPQKWHRNQVRPALSLKEYTSLVNSSRGLKSTGGEGDMGSPMRNKRLEHLGMVDDTPTTKARRRLKLPRQYRQPKISEAKLNMGTFEFGVYNKTKFCALENTHTNSYINSFIYLLYFLEPVRDALLNHLCDRELCMACELHFIYNMFAEMRGTNCHAGNTERVFRHIPQASALGILQVSAHNRALSAPSTQLTIARRIENFNRFILSELHQELSTLCPPPRPQRVQASQQNATSVAAVIDNVFGSGAVLTRKCQRCSEESTQDKRSFVVELSEPNPEASGFSPDQFTDLLQQNFQRETYSKAWCEVCKNFTTSLHKNTTTSLPHILNINCPLELSGDIPFCGTGSDGESDSDDDHTVTDVTAGGRSYGSSALPTKQMLPEYVQLTLTKDKELGVAHVPRITELKKHVPEGEGTEAVVYELTAVVSHVLDPHLKMAAQDEGRTDYEGHLVVHLKVPPAYHKGLSPEISGDPQLTPKKSDPAASPATPAMGASPAHQTAITDWYLFNDFAITPTQSIKEVTSFHSSWKVPVVIVYRRLNLLDYVPARLPPATINAKALLCDIAYGRRTPERRTFTPLSEEEIAKEAFAVAIDCEFVALSEEQVEFRSDGTKQTLKAPELGLGRVSVLRGEEGPLEGVPFIDDYIVATEPVVDYLTRFSGLEPGDLDPATSRHHLTSLKTSYLKLRWLVDHNCIFIGHGLSKDFRIINILVPPERVIDTVLLFSLPKKRKISLRFLAWWFLGINVQSANHDSIEDAHTALKLYTRYKELDAAGEVDQAIQHLYTEGVTHNFQVPVDGRLPAHLQAKAGQENLT